MRNKCVQISLFDTYSDVSRATEEDKPKFFRLLKKYINRKNLFHPIFIGLFINEWAESALTPSKVLYAR